MPGWQFDIVIFKQPLQGTVAMNPMTAVAFVFSGLALLLLAQKQENKQLLRTAKILASLALLIGALRLIAVFNFYDIGVDRLLFAGKMAVNLVANKPNSMAPNTAFNFMLAGISMLLLSNKKIVISQYLSLLTAFIALLSIIGYAYGVTAFYGVLSYLPMAVHTAACFLIFSTAILFARSDKGFMAETTSPYEGGKAARLFLPIAVFAPIMLGMFRLYGERAGLYSAPFGSALFATATIIIFVFLIWKTVASINKSEMALTKEIAERKKAEEALAEGLKEISDYKYALNESSIVDITDQKGIITSVNDKFCKVSKFSREELTGQDHRIINSGFHSKEFIGDLWLTIAQGNTWRGELKNKAKDGTYYWVYTTIVPFLNEQGKPYQYAAIRSDITERKLLDDKIKQFNRELEKRVEEKTKEVIEKEQQYRFLLENMQEGILIIGFDWKYLFVNNSVSVTAKSKYAIEELLGYSVMEKCPGIEKTKLFNVLQTCMEARSAQVLETEFKFPDGTKGWFELSIQPVPEGLFILSLDITERKKAEEEQKKYNERFKLIANTTHDAIWECNLETNELWGNEMHQRLYGLKLSDPVPTAEHWKQRIHPDDRESVITNQEAVLCSDKDVWVSEYRFKMETGNYIIIYGRCYIVRNVAGKPIRMMGSMMDITERKKAEEGFRQSQKKYFRLMNSVDGIVWEADAKTLEFSFVSKQAERLLGYPVERWISQPSFWEDHIYEEDRSWAVNYCAQHIREKIPHEFEYRMVAADGRIIWLRDIVTVQVENNEAVRLSGVMIDITEQKKGEQLLKQLNNTLEKRTDELIASNTELERFAYVASHDLQEPLRMVSSFLGLLEERIDGQLDETTRRYIHFAVDGSERMKTLIQALLQYSRVGTSKEEFTTIDLNEVMQYVSRLLEEDIKKTRGSLAVQPMPVIMANKTLISQLFINLVNNALKYHGDKEPEIEVGCMEGSDKFTFYVKDKGIGIDSRFFDKIFILFQRLHNKNEYPGTGIGLAICKKIVETHKGKIWVESKTGQGSIFYFSIPKQQI